MSTPAPSPGPAPEGLNSFTLGGYAGTPGELQGVGFWPRVGARLIDLVVHYLVALLSGFIFGLIAVVAGATAGEPASIVPHSRFTMFAFSLLGATAYETVCEGIHGSTLGKRLLGMVVVKEDGTPCTANAAFIRSLAYYIDALVFGLVAYLEMNKSPKEQRHGDNWAHTVVCRRSDVQPGYLRNDSRFVGAVMLAILADSALILAGLFLRY